jgi:GNAT superfamily N-acetyltransferase
MPHSTVRRVLPHEYGKYRQHLKALDSDSKVLRFGSPITDAVIDSLCDSFEANPSQHILFCVENNNLEFVAVGHVALQDSMELAFSVLKEHQGQGIGNALMKRAIQYCRTHGILKGCMVCLSTNATIKHLCTKYGIHFENDHGETLADIELDRPDFVTYMNEAADSNLAVMDYMGKRITKNWSFKPQKT